MNKKKNRNNQNNHDEPIIEEINNETTIDEPREENQGYKKLAEKETKKEEKEEKKEIILEEVPIPSQKTDEKSKAKYKEILIKKTRGLIKDHQSLANFKEPVILLMRRTADIDFYEQATNGDFNFTHSDGTKRTIYITRKNLHRFTYGKKGGFSGYICHEDYPTPLPESPIITSETINIAIDKTLNDLNMWTTKKINAQKNLIKTIGWILLGLAAAYILYKMLIEQTPPTTTEIEAINQTTTTIITPTII